MTFITAGPAATWRCCRACLVGACVGFLWFNSFPARVFMGDTGSLGLGGAIAALAVMTKTEVLLLIIGGIFVIEALSVADPGLLVPALPQARVPDGADPPPLRADGVVRDQDHPALLDRRGDLLRRSASRCTSSRSREPGRRSRAGPTWSSASRARALAAARMLREHGEVIGCDSGRARRTRARGRRGAPRERRARPARARAQTVVKSPGVPQRGAR